jgi:DUF1680 family protein
MKTTVDRRGFLKAVSATAGTLAVAAGRAAAVHAGETTSNKQTPAEAPVLSSVAYQPRAYSIQPKRFHEVTLKDSFWQPKMRRNAEVTIPFEIQKFQENGKPIGNNVLQAAIYSLQTYPDAKLQAQVEEAIKSLRFEDESGRVPGNSNFEVAAAYYIATGRRDALNQAIPVADAIYKIYQTTNPPFSGGERDAINCIALYGVTEDKRYLDLAKYYLDIRGLGNSVERSRHNQSYKPVLQQGEAVGHAVNDASLMVSLVDVGTLTGITDYFDAASRIWTDAVTTKLYITGGIGSTGNEGFGQPYSLPNLSAYAETCAAIMFTTFNHKMFLATGDSKYIDVMERAMYNNVADGVGAAGDTFFYVNRLATASDGRNLRWQRASLECCPPNLVRFMASMPEYIYAQRGDELFVNLYVSSQTSFKLGGKDVALAMESEMPWEGSSKITILAKEPAQATLKFRIPGWVREQPVPGDLYSYVGRLERQAVISVNGKTVSSIPDRQGYVSLSQMWRHGDQVQIEFPLEVRQVITHVKVRDNRGRTAIERGPIVYCAEWPDFAGGKVLTAVLEPNAGLKASHDDTFFGGATVLAAQAKSIGAPAGDAAPVKLIPYHLWANRGVGEMAVWLSTEEYVVGDIGPAGGLIFYVNPNYRADGWRYLEAAPFDQSAGAKWGNFRIPLEGARGSAIGAGRQNTLDIKKGCATPGTAADLCTSFSLNGIQDWFLPSFEELQAMYSNLKLAGLGGFPNDFLDNCDYWSSTQATTDMARYLDFADNGLRGHFDDKDYPRRVRAIRAV